ncbi:MAG: hydroxyacylglutathione hydrolase [Prochlorococcaceae cyanobacterium]
MSPPGSTHAPAATPAGTSSATEVALLPVLDDNYIAILHNDREAVVVDPAVAAPVIAWLEERGLQPVAVLQTHHHHDHIGGTPALLQRWPQLRVLAAAAEIGRIPFQTEGLHDGDRLQVLGRPLEVLAVPGHTRGHLAFHLPAHGGQPPELFCGDALFAAGCGRLFEGTPEQLHASLQRLAALPAATRVWCAHEYTLTNLRWAADLRPGDGAIQARLAAVRQQRAAGLPSLPSTIGEEGRTNLFLQAADAVEVGRLRQHKDQWLPLSPEPAR